MLKQRNMGDSSACVMQPFCYSSGFPNEANNKSNPINADGESVSFGRFMTESLAWEKWSTFSSSQNRYVEEAERISRPGSVAQKKAFFEAHYKKLAAQKAAAALQEQQNSTSQVGNTSKLNVNEEYERTSNIENNKVEGPQPEKEMQNQLEDVEKKGSNFDKEVLHSMARKKAPISSLDVVTSKFLSTAINSRAPTVSDRDNIATPNPMNNSTSVRKKISNAKSLHMSFKFAFIRVMRKLETTRVRDGSSTASMDSWTPLTQKTKVSMNELQKHPSFATLTENNRKIISSPFDLRTEEREANEKKKIGKKIDASEEQKRKLHVKLKEKAVIKIRKLRPNFCFKARPLSEFDNEIEVSKKGTKEDYLAPSESPHQGRRSTISVVHSKSSLSTERLFHEKNDISLNSNSTMISTTHENTSPNILQGNQNGRNC